MNEGPHVRGCNEHRTKPKSLGRSAQSTPRRLGLAANLNWGWGSRPPRCLVGASAFVRWTMKKLSIVRGAELHVTTQFFRALVAPLSTLLSHASSAVRMSFFFQEAFLIQRRLEAQINALNQEAAQLRQQHTNSQARIRSLEERNSQLKVRGGPTPDPTPKTLSVGNPARPQRCTRGCENTQPRVSRLGPLLN